MSFQLTKWVIRNGPTQKSDFLVLLALADHANDEGECWPSIDRIAEVSRCHRSAVFKSLKRLELSGYINIRNTPKGNLYWVSFRDSGIKAVSPEDLSGLTGRPRGSPQKTEGVSQEDPNRTENIIENKSINKSDNPIVDFDFDKILDGIDLRYKP